MNLTLPFRVPPEVVRGLLITLAIAWGMPLTLEPSALGADLFNNAMKELNLESIDDTAPNFSLQSSSGQSSSGEVIEFSKMVGKPILLHFWATWCEPCVQELPLIQEMAQSKLKDKATLISVAIDPPTQKQQVNDFLKKIKFTLPVWIAQGDHKIDPYTYGGIPATYFILPSGKLSARAIGPREWKSTRFPLEDLLSALFKTH